MLVSSVVIFPNRKFMLDCVVISGGVVCELMSDDTLDGAFAESLVEDLDELYTLPYCTVTSVRAISQSHC